MVLSFPGNLEILDNYKAPRGCIASGTKKTPYHSDVGPVYYICTPTQEMQLAIFDEIVKYYENEAPGPYLNEHIMEEQKTFPLFFDLETFTDEEDAWTMLEELQDAVKIFFMPQVCEGKPDFIHNDIPNTSGCPKGLLDPYFGLTAKCKRKTKAGYWGLGVHVVWPHIMVTKSIIQKFIVSLSANAWTDKIDLQVASNGSLRMLYCDKYNRAERRPEKRKLLPWRYLGEECMGENIIADTNFGPKEMIHAMSLLRSGPPTQYKGLQSLAIPDEILDAFMFEPDWLQTPILPMRRSYFDLLAETESIQPATREAVTSVVIKWLNQYLAFMEGESIDKPRLIMRDVVSSDCAPTVFQKSSSAVSVSLKWCKVDIINDEAKQTYDKNTGEPIQKRKKAVYCYDLWLDSIFRRHYDRLVFVPPFMKNRDELLKGCLNSWCGYATQPSFWRERKNYSLRGENGTLFDVNFWLKYVFNVICSRQEESYKYYINWLATIIQKPGVKIGVVPILCGPPGCGKNLHIQSVFEAAYGEEEQFKVKSSMYSVLGRFANLHGSIVVVVNEIPPGMSHQEVAQLKALVTDRNERSERKFAMETNGPACTNFLFTTNHLSTGDRGGKPLFEVNQDPRRWFFVPVSDELSSHSQSQRFEFWNDFEKWITSGGQYAILHYLNGVKLENLPIPVTMGLVEAKLSSLSSCNAWIVEVLKNGTIQDGEDLGAVKRLDWGVDTSETFPLKQLHGAYKDWCGRNGKTKEIAPATQLQRALELLTSARTIKARKTTETGVPYREFAVKLSPIHEARRSLARQIPGMELVVCVDEPRTIERYSSTSSIGDDWNASQNMFQ